MDSLSTALFTGLMMPIALLGAVPLFIYVYVILRWRAGAQPEPGLGSYSLVLMFRLFAVLLGVGALSLLAYAAISSDDHEQMTRVCWPVLVASVIFLGVQFVVGSTLGDPERFAVARRLFGGGLVAIAGLVMFGALVGLLITSWEKMPDEPESYAAKGHTDRLKMFGAWLVCFGGVYLASVLRMAKGAGSLAPTPP